ncbi:MAG: ABC transporter ATP-binding protein [Actinobacteria bacterium]|nr:ABC transporter ATP-binding protein [Actinomycetota bacterium]
MALLEVRDLRTGYGHVPVLHGVSFSVDEGETAVMLGLNGAGKTTCMLAVAGLLRRWGGEVLFDGRPVGKHQDSRAMTRLGVVLVPEGRHVFPGLSVQNNLRLGAWPVRRHPRKVKANTDRVFDVFPLLAERRHQLAGTLSGGEQQMLALGRGLMGSPRLLLIDEASLGLSPVLAQQVFQAARRINSEGVTVLMVEQNAGALSLADRALLMQKGRIAMEGSGADLMSESALRQAYLGAPA